jgi:hypothetical protein
LRQGGLPQRRDRGPGCSRGRSSRGWLRAYGAL